MCRPISAGAADSTRFPLPPNSISIESPICSSQWVPSVPCGDRPVSFASNTRLANVITGSISGATRNGVTAVNPGRPPETAGRVSATVVSIVMFLSRLRLRRSLNSACGQPASAVAIDVRAWSSISSAMTSLQFISQVLQRPPLELLDGTLRPAHRRGRLLNALAVAEAHLHDAPLVRRQPLDELKQQDAPFELGCVRLDVRRLGHGFPGRAPPPIRQLVGGDAIQPGDERDSA